MARRGVSWLQLLWLASAVLELQWLAADAAITSATISLALIAAGEVTTATVKFTTGASVPIGGSIRVSFPTSFVVAPTTVTVTMGMSSTPTMAVSGADVMLTIAGAAVGPGLVQFDLDGVTNPGDPRHLSLKVTCDHFTNTLPRRFKVPGPRRHSRSSLPRAQVRCSSRRQ